MTNQGFPQDLMKKGRNKRWKYNEEELYTNTLTLRTKKENGNMEPW